MGSGGLFGNLTLSLSFLSSINVVASKNVDILQISTEKLKYVFQNYPNLLNRSKEMGWEDNDYVIPMDQPLRKIESDEDQNIHYSLEDIEIPRGTRKVRTFQKNYEKLIAAKIIVLNVFYSLRWNQKNRRAALSNYHPKKGLIILKKRSLNYQKLQFSRT